MTPQTLQAHLAEVIDQHHQADDYGYPTEFCMCGDDIDGTDTWAGHLALILSESLIEFGSWDLLMTLLDRHYPEDIFPTMEDRPDRDPGPRIVSLIRYLNESRKGLA